MVTIPNKLLNKIQWTNSIKNNFLILWYTDIGNKCWLLLIATESIMLKMYALIILKGFMIPLECNIIEIRFSI